MKTKCTRTRSCSIRPWESSMRPPPESLRSPGACQTMVGATNLPAISISIRAIPNESRRARTGVTRKWTSSPTSATYRAKAGLLVAADGTTADNPIVPPASTADGGTQWTSSRMRRTKCVKPELLLLWVSLLSRGAFQRTFCMTVPTIRCTGNAVHTASQRWHRHSGGSW